MKIRDIISKSPWADAEGYTYWEDEPWIVYNGDNPIATYPSEEEARRVIMSTSSPNIYTVRRKISVVADLDRNKKAASGAA